MYQVIKPRDLIQFLRFTLPQKVSLGLGNTCPWARGVFECVGGSVGKHNILPMGPGALSPGSSHESNEPGDPTAALADICPRASPSQAGRAPGAGSAQGCRCVGSASAELGSPACHQPGASLCNCRHRETSKGKANCTCL